MKAPVLCAILCAALAVPAAGEPRYDRRLEEAAMQIVAGKMGAIRGEFAYNSAPTLTPSADPIKTASTDAKPAPERTVDPEPTGLSRATERRIADIVTTF